MPATSLVKSQHQFFLIALSRLLSERHSARLVDGQQWENVYRQQAVSVALSDTARDPHTDRKLGRQVFGLITIEFLTTDPAQQRQGQASQVLRVLTQQADRWSIRLRLRPLAHETSPLGDEQLRAWYGRHGFTEAEGLYLNRPPRTKL